MRTCNSSQGLFLHVRHTAATLLEEIFLGSQPATWEVKDEQKELPCMRAAFPGTGSRQEVVPCRAVRYSTRIRAFSG